MDRAESVRFPVVRSDLGEKFIVGYSGRCDQSQFVADLSFDGPGNVHRQRDSLFVPGNVQKSFVECDRLDQVGVFAENPVNLPRHFAVDFHPSGNENQFGTQPSGRNGRHGRTDAVAPRLVAGRGDHAAAFGTAYGQRTAPVFGVVALFDRRVERIHVDVYDFPLFHPAVKIGLISYKFTGGRGMRNNRRACRRCVWSR